MRPSQRGRRGKLLLTRETDYALRILRALSGKDRLTAGELAAQDQVPQQFAYKILKKLERAGLVEITRGAGGGCRLAADLAASTLYDLMAAMEDDHSVAACLEPGYHCTWREAHDGAACTVHCRLVQMQRRLDDELRSLSLKALLIGG